MEDDSIAKNRSKIVIGVDDNPANLAFLKTTISAAGYSFVGLSGGAECLSIVLRFPPRLILLDIQMPGMDGFETCRRLRGMAETRNVPIAFLTGRRTREDVQQGLAAGGNDFIIKPFDREHLLARVQMWTGRRVEPVVMPPPTPPPPKAE
jgi:two-component system OmpR family response regulator